jgi:hypothetical protein
LHERLKERIDSPDDGEAVIYLSFAEALVATGEAEAAGRANVRILALAKAR